MSKKKGRPPKGPEKTKAEFLQVRVELAEKETLSAAAELSGLDLSAWVRERLRLVAKKELEASGSPVPFLAKRQAGGKDEKSPAS
jgi:hypothetical protein